MPAVGWCVSPSCPPPLLLVVFMLVLAPFSFLAESELGTLGYML